MKATLRIYFPFEVRLKTGADSYARVDGKQKICTLFFKVFVISSPYLVRLLGGPIPILVRPQSVISSHYRLPTHQHPMGFFSLKALYHFHFLRR